MIKRTDDEIACIKNYIEKNCEMSPQEIADEVNSSGLVRSGTVKKSYIVYLKYGKNREKKASKKEAEKPTRKYTKKAKAETEPVAMEYSFDGFLKRLEDLGTYAKLLRDKQKEKVAAFLE